MVLRKKFDITEPPKTTLYVPLMLRHDITSQSKCVA